MLGYFSKKKVQGIVNEIYEDNMTCAVNTHV